MPHVSPRENATGETVQCRRFPAGHCLPAVLFVLALSVNPLAAADADPGISAWLAANEGLTTWSAELVQTRKLVALAQPLVATGQVYYTKPGYFRWELGDPPETIAIRSTNELLLVYPALNRAERYPMEGDDAGPLRNALTLMEAGFPKDEATLRRHFTLSSQPAAQDHWRVTMEPRESAGRQLVSRVSLTFNTNGFTLTTSEIEFADGSLLRNDYPTSTANESLSPGLFSTNLPAGCKVVEPFKP